MMTSKTELVGGSSLENNVMCAQEEKHSVEKSEMCIGWNYTMHSCNIATGLTVTTTKLISLASDKAKLVTNTTPIIITTTKSSYSNIQTDHDHDHTRLIG